MATKLSGRKTAKLKRRRRPRQWKVRNNILDVTAFFAIDRQIQAAPLQSRWQQSDAIAFGRRTLQVAIEDARSIEEKYHPGETLAYWKRTAHLAARAHSLLELLIRHIGPKGVPATDILGPPVRVPVSMTKSGKLRIGIGPVGQSFDQAKNDTAALIAARDALAGFADRCQRRRDGLAFGRKNEGDSWKACFRLSAGGGLDIPYRQTPWQKLPPQSLPQTGHSRVDGWRDSETVRKIFRGLWMQR